MSIVILFKYEIKQLIKHRLINYIVLYCIVLYCIVLYYGPPRSGVVL